MVHPFTDAAENFNFKADYFLQPADFTDNSDLVGLFSSEDEPQKFFIEDSLDPEFFVKSEEAADSDIKRLPVS